MKQEPVVWWTGKTECEEDDFMYPKLRQAHIDHPESCTHKFYPVPLYTHPHKELSDEEIWKIYNITGLGNGMAVRFARAIIKASRGEE